MVERVGVLGGTFDPIHNEHLLVARVAAWVLRLDRVLFVPVGEPSHRDATALSPSHHRCAMVECAIADDDRFEVSTVDVDRSRPTYTIDTLDDLATVLPSAAAVHLLVGADNLADLRSWHRSDELVHRTHVVGASRWGHPLANPGLPLDRLTLLAVPHGNMSGTRIRGRVADGLPIRHLVPPAVARYIDRHALYRATGSDRIEPRQ